MIKIINGKRYNTETASKVFYTNNIDGRDVVSAGDVGFHEASLYQTKSGAWFLHSYGAQYSGASGDHMRAMSDNEAFDFLEYNSVDSDARNAIDQHFAKKVEEA